jgi:hypothetical protein
MIFSIIIITFALNNVLKAVNKDLSLVASVFRLTEGFFFVISIVLLFAEVSLFNLILILSQFFLAVHMILVGYLVFKSGYLSRILGIFLVIGGSTGYLIGNLTHFYLPNFNWLSTIGLMVAFIAEFALGIILVIKAIKMTMNRPDSKKTITMILGDLGEATTAEIIDEASLVSRDCKDRIPKTLIALEKDKKVIKRISKEKKGFVWTLVS